MLLLGVEIVWCIGKARELDNKLTTVLRAPSFEIRHFFITNNEFSSSRVIIGNSRIHELERLVGLRQVLLSKSREEMPSEEEMRQYDNAGEYARMCLC